MRCSIDDRASLAPGFHPGVFSKRERRTARDCKAAFAREVIRCRMLVVGRLEEGASTLFPRLIWRNYESGQS